MAEKSFKKSATYCCESCGKEFGVKYSGRNGPEFCPFCSEGLIDESGRPMLMDFDELDEFDETQLESSEFDPDFDEE